MSIGFDQALWVIENGIKLWMEIKGAQEEVDLMGRQLEEITGYIRNAQKLVPRHEEAMLRVASEDLYLQVQRTMTAIKSDSTRAESILASWQDIAHWLPGAKWSNQWISAFSALVKGRAGELRELRESLVKHQSALNGWILLMNYATTKAIMQQLRDQKFSKLQPSPGPPKKKSPSPSPKPKRKSVIFVDSYNSGRSVLAQSYLFLVEQWTTRTRNYWPLERWESAGINVQSRAAFVEQLQEIRKPFHLVNGGTPAFAVALNALFDQPFFNYKYKPPIRERALQRKSRGLPVDLFSGYDYILVFTREQRDVLEALREHLAAKPWIDKKANSRAKIELLGTYGNHNKAEIAAPKDSDEERDKKWGKIAGNVKTCIKAFLTQQCGWSTPDWKDGHLQGPKLTAPKPAA